MTGKKKGTFIFFGLREEKGVGKLCFPGQPGASGHVGACEAELRDLRPQAELGDENEQHVT